MQKKLFFTSADNESKEFLTNIKVIDATRLDSDTKQYLYAPQSVTVNGQIIGFDMEGGFTDPVSGKYFICPEISNF